LIGGAVTVDRILRVSRRVQHVESGTSPGGRFGDRARLLFFDRRQKIADQVFRRIDDMLLCRKSVLPDVVDEFLEPADPLLLHRLLQLVDFAVPLGVARIGRRIVAEDIFSEKGSVSTNTRLPF
jgi:hypothetical protein